LHDLAVPGCQFLILLPLRRLLRCWSQARTLGLYGTQVRLEQHLLLRYARQHSIEVADALFEDIHLHLVRLVLLG
jgi:hypothetical protein